MTRNVFILQSHFIDETIERLFGRLMREKPESYDLFLLLNENAKTPSVLPASIPEDRVLRSSQGDLLAMNYPRKCDPQGCDGKGWAIIPGNCDLNILYFYKNKPQYDYYWISEYDVHFEGRWGDFLSHFENSSAALLGTTLYHADQTPHKPMNPPLLTPDGKAYDLARAVRGFYPILRLSKDALACLDREYAKGWGGHQELLMGTILKDNGLDIEDIGGHGPYVKPENIDRFYFNTRRTHSLPPGTFVWRPAFKKTMPFKNTLWHPIKPETIETYKPHIHDENDFFARLKSALKYKLSFLYIRVWGLKRRFLQNRQTDQEQP